MFPLRVFPSIIVLVLFGHMVGLSNRNQRVSAYDDRSSQSSKDSLQIVISDHIKKKYPCIFSLLQEMIEKNDSARLIEGLTIFQQPGRSHLYIMDKRLKKKLAAETLPGSSLNSVDEDFVDTIYLNRRFLKRASREYLVAVITHECYHVYFNWCFHQWIKKLLPVDTAYLQAHFSERWNWMSSGRVFLSDSGHELMSLQFLPNIKQFVDLFTNPAVRRSLRDSIALSLAWGGLHETPGFRNQPLDTCYMQSVDGWARNLQKAKRKSRFEEGKCVTRKGFLDSLYLLPCRN